MYIDNKEIFRYAGYKSNTPDENIIDIIEQLKNEVVSCVSPKSIYKETDFVKTEDCVIINNIEFRSKKLVNHLKNSERLVVFAATLGIESDRLIRKNMAQSTAKAVLVQAVLTAAIESYCDEVCDEIAKNEEENGFYLRPRFSPGYGDLPLTSQKDVFSLIDITKRTGIILTDDCLMIPSKSVTAFIGLTRDKDCSIKSCKTCENTECEFRREV